MIKECMHECVCKEYLTGIGLLGILATSIRPHTIGAPIARAGDPIHVVPLPPSGGRGGKRAGVRKQRDRGYGPLMPIPMDSIPHTFITDDDCRGPYVRSAHQSHVSAFESCPHILGFGRKRHGLSDRICPRVSWTHVCTGKSAENRTATTDSNKNQAQ